MKAILIKDTIVGIKGDIVNVFKGTMVQELGLCLPKILAYNENTGIQYIIPIDSFRIIDESDYKCFNY